MNFLIKFFCIVHIIMMNYSSMIFIVACDDLGLTALNDSPHSLQLYLSLRNTHFPSDPATSNALLRERICEEVTGADDGFFYRILGFSSVNKSEMLNKLPPLIFPIIFSPSSSQDSDEFEYRNEYEFVTFIFNDSLEIGEYVFMCPVEDLATNKISSGFYVSKEYNVSPFGDKLFMRGRFVFAFYEPRHSNSVDTFLLAEEPSYAHTESNFDVELHYLRIRKYILPAESDEIDPLCKHKQHYRFCVAVSRSSYYKKEFSYPEENSFICEEKEVSFRTTGDIKETAVGSPYFERMILCPSVPLDSRKREVSLYISRAYACNQVFVYRFDPSDNKIYPENLMFNISVRDELNSFDFVEE